jgi:hypothetical protein
VGVSLKKKELLKVVLCGGIRKEDTTKLGVVSVVLITYDRDLAQEKMQELIVKHPENCYMVYSVPEDMDLTMLAQYPSMAITKEDLE